MSLKIKIKKLIRETPL